MIITENMSSEELAQHFSEQKVDNASNIIPPVEEGNKLPANMQELIDSSNSEELAKRAEELKAEIKPEGDKNKKPEADVSKKAPAKNTGTPLDESFVCEFFVTFFVFPTACSQSAFHKNQAALMQIFLSQFCQATP